MSHHVVRHIRYNFEYETRLKACFVGAGGHSYRNVYPALRYAPVDLVAICDVEIARAEEYGRIFGAPRAYSDHHEMFAREKPDLVFIVTGYSPDGHVLATGIASDALDAGAHVWMEKPTAASIAEILALQMKSAKTGLQVMTGLKKIFFPTIEKLKDIIDAPEFGGLAALSVRYPQSLPPPEQRGDLVAMQSFLDHIYHPAAILLYLAGPIERASYEWEPRNGGCMTSLRFRSGAIGTLQFAAGASWSSPLERVEAIGSKANAVVENGVKLTYYRPADLPSYGRAASFIHPDDATPLHWEPECSLGQLYNNNLFYLGYVPEILHLTDAVLSGAPISKGTLGEALEIMKLFEFFRTASPGVSRPL